MRDEQEQPPRIPYIGTPFTSLLDYPPGTLVVKKPKVKRLEDGSYRVTYRFEVK